MSGAERSRDHNIIAAQLRRAVEAIGHFEMAPTGRPVWGVPFWRRVRTHTASDAGAADECRRAGGRCAYEAILEKAQ